MNRKECQQYFELLESVFTENELFLKPASIFNVHKTGLQLNTLFLQKKIPKYISTVTRPQT